jgi:glucoamylase
VSTWTSAAKEAVGASLGPSSRVWFTLQGGVLTEVYYPRLDVANVRTLELAVSDGTSTWFESEDLLHDLEQLDERALLFRQTSRHPGGLFSLSKTYVTDPARDTLLVDVTFRSEKPIYEVYVVYDPSLGNTSQGDTGWSEGGALLAEERRVASALLSSAGFVRATTGFVGTASDGRAELRRHKRLVTLHGRAEKGNVVQVAQLPQARHLTLALGFGWSSSRAQDNARASLRRGFAIVSAEYTALWHAYLAGLRLPAADHHRRPLQLAAMVLKAHEDKTYRGAGVASLSIPWGTARPADDPRTAGYHLVWSRDLYQVATAFLLLHDRASAEAALDYLFRTQQRPDGTFPQNSWLDGRPYWPSLQMDEIAYPLILAWQLGRADARTFARHVRPAADFLVAQGPATPQDRWEEESGYSPSTIAAEIAGLICAAEIAERNQAAERARRYRSVADAWASSLERWMVTTTGTLDDRLHDQGYYLRINNNTDPDDGFPLEINNGGGTFDERQVADAGFLELVRLGIRPPGDPVIERSVAVVDATLRVNTPQGPYFYRYNHDGYGEHADGAPYDGGGVGRLWPLLSGERGEYEIARGRDAGPYIEAMLRSANRGGMIPEQVWDRGDHSPRGLKLGQGTGSATPLAWSMAQLVRLLVDAAEGRVVEQPKVVADRYLRKAGGRPTGR